MMKTKISTILLGASLVLAAGCGQSGLEPDTPSMPVLHIGDDVAGGVVVYVDPVDSTAGKVLEKNYVTEQTWSEFSSRVGCNSHWDGVANTAVLRASSHYPENYPALMHCDELGSDWYIPAADEWAAVYAKWNGSSSKAEDAEARKAFDDLLKAAGAQPMNPNPETTENGQSYWSSTESESTNANAYYVRFGVYAKSEGTKKSQNRLTRCMKVVGTLTPRPELSLASRSLTIGSEAGSRGSVKVTSNYDVDVQVPEDADWLEVEVSTFLSVQSVMVTALSANDSKLERKATVMVSAGPEKMRTTVGLVVAQEPGIKQVSHLREIYGGGIVVWQNPEEETDIKIMSLKRLTANRGWCDASEQDTLTGALDEEDGAGNTAKILALPNAGLYHAAMYCKNMGEGWYLPAKNELLALFATYNGVSSWEMCEKGKPEEVAEKAPVQYKARADFEALFAANDGDVFNSMDDTRNGDSYWSSTESPDNVQYAYYLRVGAFDNATMAKRGTARYARCFKKVTYVK